MMLLKIFHKTIFVAILFALCSCGVSKSNRKIKEGDNQLKKNDPSQNPSSGESGQSPLQEIMTSIKSNPNYGCPKGQYRLDNDLAVHKTNIPDGISLLVQGPFSSGPLTQEGQVDKIYVGRSEFNDLLFVSKIIKKTDGTEKILGVNITLSLCSKHYTPFSNGEQVAKIGNEREPTHFKAPNGIALDGSLICQYSGHLALTALGTQLTIPAHLGLNSSWEIRDFNFPVSCSQ